MNLIYEKKLFSLDKTEFENLRTELSIILKSNESKQNNTQDLKVIFSMKPKIIKFHLKRLEHLGFVKISIKKPNYYKLTDRGYFFKLGLEKESEKIEENFVEKGIDFCYKLFNLNKISVKI